MTLTPFRIARFDPAGKPTETLVVDDVRVDEPIEDAWFKRPVAPPSALPR